mgnify:CR=1 FL=1
MRYLENFKIYESNENVSGTKERSERLLTQAQVEYKEDPNKPSDSVNLPSIMFTDVEGSSKLWSDDPISMAKQIEEHHKLIDSLSAKWNGWIVKTIGDAFMVYFEPSEKSLENALMCAKEIILNEKKYNLRIGICNGPMDQKTYRIQKVDLKDFYGNSVNVASRMESKVAGESGVIAFTSVLKGGEPASVTNTQTSKWGKIGKLESVDISKYDLKGAIAKKAWKLKIK